MIERIRSQKPSTHEWTHHILSEEVGSKPFRATISVPEESIPALCKRLGIHSIESLKADFVLTRNPVTKIIQVKGELRADLCQYCVVTIQPVLEHIEDSFEAWLAEPNNSVSFAKAKRERMSPQELIEQPMLDEYDDPELIVDGKIDLGELATQHLSLSLNPYPRKEGAALKGDDNALEDEEEGMYNNPFAALKDWKASEKKKD